MSVNPLVVVSSLLLALGTYVMVRLKSRISPGIPYAGGDSLMARLRVPVDYAKDPASFLVKHRKQLGDIFCVDLIVTKIVFFLGAHHNKMLLKGKEEELGYWNFHEYILGPRLSKSIQVPNYRQTNIKTIRTGLSRPDFLAQYNEACEGVAERFFESWCEKESVPLFRSITELDLHLLLIMLAGREFLDMHGEELVPLLAGFEHNMQKVILRILPWSLWRFSKPGAFILRLQDRFGELMEAGAHDIVNNPDKHKGRSDYFYYLVSQHGVEFAQCYGIQIMMLIFGGFANVAMAVPWIWLHARRKPGALERLREEGSLPLGESKPYVEACIYETSRLYTHNLISRMTRKSVEVSGHIIPANTVCSISPVAHQRLDASEGGVYEESTKWIPERFLAPNALSEWLARGDFVQFGVGPHACPGDKMSKILMRDHLIKTWADGYEFEAVSGLQEGVKGIDGVGLEGAWVECNFGTPNARGGDVYIKVTRRAKKVVN